MLGVTAGVFMRRTLPAMATTLAVFAGARLAMTYWVRPHLMTPIRVTSAFRAGQEFTASGASGLVSVIGAKPGAWVYSSYLADTARPACYARGLPGRKLLELFSRASSMRREVPRGPDLPAAEPLLGLPVVRGGDFLGLSLILAGLCFWWNPPPSLLTGPSPP